MTRRAAVRRQANAKINVFLRVLRARDDGYHDIESLVVPVSLADRITARAAGPGSSVTSRGSVSPASSS